MVFVRTRTGLANSSPISETRSPLVRREDVSQFLCPISIDLFSGWHLLKDGGPVANGNGNWICEKLPEESGVLLGAPALGDTLLGKLPMLPLYSRRHHRS